MVILFGSLELDISMTFSMDQVFFLWIPEVFFLIVAQLVLPSVYSAKMAVSWISVWFHSKYLFILEKTTNL